MTLRLHGMFHFAIQFATCFETKMRNKLGDKLKGVTAPLSTEVPNQSTEVLTINLQFAMFKKKSKCIKRIS